MPVPPAYVSHALPGRTRIKVPDRRGAAGYFEDVRQALASCPGVEEVTVNAVTGSILVRHAASVAAVADHAAGAGLFALNGLEPGEPPLAQKLRTQMAALDSRLKSAVGGELDLWTTVSILYLAFAVVQLLRGNVLGPVTTLAWTALAAMRLAQQSR